MAIGGVIILLFKILICLILFGSLVVKEGEERERWYKEKVRMMIMLVWLSDLNKDRINERQERGTQKNLVEFLKL